MPEDNYPPTELYHANATLTNGNMTNPKLSRKTPQPHLPETMISVEDERPDFEGSAKYRAKNKIIMNQPKQMGHLNRNDSQSTLKV